jgi:hypothetical protein
MCWVVKPLRVECGTLGRMRRFDVRFGDAGGWGGVMGWLQPKGYRWSEQAILALDEAMRGGSEEMHLQASFGVSSMQMRG